MTRPGRLTGVGVGPGDPELLTLKALRTLRQSDVIAYFAKAGNTSHARSAAEVHLKPDCQWLPLLYPVTTELPRDSAGYREKIEAFFDSSAASIAKLLDAGKTVSVLSEGDPLFYGSYLHIHVRLSESYPAEVIPGVTSPSGCWSQAGVAMTSGDEVLSVLPATLAEDDLVRRLRDSGAAVILKLGRNLPKVRRALESSRTIDRALYVENGTTADARLMSLVDKDDDRAPYFSLILVPGRGTPA